MCLWVTKPTLTSEVLQMRSQIEHPTPYECSRYNLVVQAYIKLNSAERGLDIHPPITVHVSAWNLTLPLKFQGLGYEHT